MHHLIKLRPGCNKSKEAGNFLQKDRRGGCHLALTSGHFQTTNNHINPHQVALQSGCAVLGWDRKWVLTSPSTSFWSLRGSAVVSWQTVSRPCPDKPSLVSTWMSMKVSLSLTASWSHDSWVYIIFKNLKKFSGFYLTKINYINKSYFNLKFTPKLPKIRKISQKKWDFFHTNSLSCQ